MSEIAQRQAPLVHSPYDRNAMSFSDMLDEAVEVQGNQLVKDDIADELEGVPFVITKVTFRPGMLDPGDKSRRLAYVSCEAVIADEVYLAKRKVNLDEKPFLPGDHIVFNDGSTGIYRQIVAVLESVGYITLPDGPVAGPKGACRYDAPPAEWDETPVGESHVDQSMGENFWHYSADVRIFAPRGIRVSEYANDYTQDGKTRYLA